MGLKGRFSGILPPLLLILICLTISFVLFKNNSANFTYDDFNYITYALQMRIGAFNPLQSPYAFGYLFPFTIFVSYNLLGINTISTSAPQILEYIILVLLSYATASKLFNRKLAFAGALALAVSAFIAIYATRPLPDMLVGDLVALALYLLTSEDKITSSSFTKLNNWAYFFAGIVIGTIVFVKLGAIIPALALAFALLVLEKGKTIPFIIGTIMVSFVYFMSIGTLNVVSSYSALQVHLSHVQTTLWGNLYTMLYLMPFGYNLHSLWFVQTFPLGLMFIFAILGTYQIFQNKENKLAVVSLVFWFTFLYLFLGTEGLHHYQLIVVVSRYFIWIAMPMMILATYFFWNMYKNSNHGNLYIAILVLLVLLSNLPMLWFFAQPISHSI